MLLIMFWKLRFIFKICNVCYLYIKLVFGSPLEFWSSEHPFLALESVFTPDYNAVYDVNTCYDYRYFVTLVYIDELSIRNIGSDLSRIQFASS